MTLPPHMDPEVRRVLEFVRHNPGRTAKRIGLQLFAGAHFSQSLAHRALKALHMCGFVRREIPEGLNPSMRWYAQVMEAP